MKASVKNGYRDYEERKYLSSIEAAKWLGISVEILHGLAKAEKIRYLTAASGQKRFDLQDLINHEKTLPKLNKKKKKGFDKYGHLTKEQKEASKLDKDFWLKIKNSDVWMMKPEKSGDRRSHAAPFPYELPYRLIKAFTYKSENVLDPFLGSGTTLKAAADLGRNGVGYEIVPEIVELAVKRLENNQSKFV